MRAAPLRAYAAPPAVEERPEPLAYQKAYGAALAHLGLPYPDIST